MSVMLTAFLISAKFVDNGFLLFDDGANNSDMLIRHRSSFYFFVDIILLLIIPNRIRANVINEYVIR